jgi:4-hydroxybenzoate polyprenyltransferase
LTRRRLHAVQAYFRLPHAVPVLVVLVTTAAFAVIAANGLPPRARLAEVLLAMLCAQLVIGAVNELVDADTDALVKPTKPIPAGLVTRRSAGFIAAISLIGMIGFGARLGRPSLVLCTFGTAVGVAYSMWFKRTILAWLPYLIALPLLPIWVFVAVTGFEVRLLMLYPLGALAVFAVHLGQSLPDVTADRTAGVRNVTSKLGERTALLLCLGSMIVSALGATVAAAFWADPVVVAAAAGVVAGLVAAVVALYLWRPRTGVLACFPCVAIGTAVLGAGWVLAVTR